MLLIKINMLCYTTTLHLQQKKIYQQIFLPLPLLEEMEKSEYAARNLLVTPYPAFRDLSPIWLDVVLQHTDLDLLVRIQ